MSAQFNKVHRIWKSEPGYVTNPWASFVRFIEILQERGASFITFSEALAGDYDPQAITILLDHHIDFYIIETEVMCRWERDNGVRSSVYLFNEFRYAHDSPQRTNWDLADLNIPFYQQLERDGFEVGYHQNAVGRALLLTGAPRVRRRPRDLSPEVTSLAQGMFAQDVESLSRYFDIRTFIPHGAGENNAQLIDLPAGYDERITWVYNNAKRNGTVEQPLSFRNFSDSCGQRAQRFRDGNTTWISHVDNLCTHAMLVGPGLNHILIHPGRFGAGMPYETYDWTPVDDEQTVVEYEFESPDDPAELPWLSDRVMCDWRGDDSVSQRRPAFTPPSPAVGSRVLTNNLFVLEDRLTHHAEAIVTLVVPERLRRGPDQAHKLDYRRRVSHPMPGEGVDHSLDRVRDEFLCFYNVFFSSQPLEAMVESTMRMDEVHLHGLTIGRKRALKAILSILRPSKRFATMHLTTTADLWAWMTTRLRDHTTSIVRPGRTEGDVEVFMRTAGTTGMTPGLPALSWTEVEPWLKAEALDTTPRLYRPDERTTTRTPA